MNHLLQRSLTPAPQFGEPTLYVRTTGTAKFAAGSGDSTSGSKVDLAPGATVTFDTSFGVFQAGR